MTNKWKVTSILYIIFISVLLVMAIGGSLLISRYSYLAGLHHSEEDIKSFGIIIFLLPLMVTIALASFIIALKGLFSTNGEIGKIIFQLILILIGPAIIYGFFKLTPPGAAVYLEGFEQYVLKEVDIGSVQDWLATEGTRYAGQRYDSDQGKGYPEELPASLTKLHPWYISFSNSNADKGPTITLWWPHLMDDDVLIIGPPDMEMPQDDYIEIDDSNIKIIRVICPGVYVYSKG